MRTWVVGDARNHGQDPRFAQNDRALNPNEIVPKPVEPVRLPVLPVELAISGFY
jgi:hypothetical protein